MVAVVVYYYAYAVRSSSVSGPSVVAGGDLPLGGLPRLRGAGLLTLSGFNSPSPGVAGVSV